MPDDFDAPLFASQNLSQEQSAPASSTTWAHVTASFSDIRNPAPTVLPLLFSTRMVKSSNKRFLFFMKKQRFRIIALISN